jgi:glycosyltransferase involved in cell wall biosynthesis
MNIVQVGPDVSKVGGISSVIKTLSELKIDGCTVTNLASWRPRSLFGFIPWMRCVAYVIRDRLTVREIDLLHIHFSNGGSYLREGSILLLGRLLGINSVSTLHGSKLAIKTKISKWDFHFKLIASYSKKVICISPGTQNLFTVSKALVLLVANPLAQSIDTKPRDFNSTEKVVLFGGVRDFRKGFDAYASAGKSLSLLYKDWSFGVAGPKGDSGHLIEGQNFQDFGELSHEEFIEKLRSVRILCLPSREEQSPVVIWEALSMGVCVVATRVGAIEWILGKDYPFYCDLNISGSLEMALKLAIDSDLEEMASFLRSKSIPALSDVQSNLWKEIYQN